MTQLGLQLTERLPYDAKSFIQHGGVREILIDAFAAVLNPGFACRLYTGEPRTGKTHLSVLIGDAARKAGLVTTYLDGTQVLKEAAAITSSKNWTKFDAVIVDDADFYFSKVLPGQSGPFVTLYEALRLAGAKLFLISGKSIESYSCDDHTMSRLRAAFVGQILDPDLEELPPLIQVMAGQRGVKLKDQKLKFIARRIPRTIPGIESYLNRVLHLSKMFGAKIKYPLLNDAV